MTKQFATVHLALIALVVAQPVQAERYWRLELVQENSRTTTFFDRHCDPDGAVAYFGCVAGDDDRPIGAYGDFSGSLGGEAALGWRLGRAWRGEIMLGHQPGFDFSGNANFLSTGSHEPVRGSLDHTRLGVNAYLDLAQAAGRDWGAFEPWLGAGVGVARNRIGTMVYEFPELDSQPARTTVPGGTHTGLAWRAGLGAGWRIGEQHVLDISVRYNDHGRVATDRGDIRVIRNGDLVAEVTVGATRARLSSWSLGVGLRRSF